MADFFPTNGSTHTLTLPAGPLVVSLYANAQLPTRFGDFHIFVFRNTQDHLEHVAVVRGQPWLQSEPVFIRMHSECLTGDVLGSLRCDCRDQFELTMTKLGNMEHGALLYLRQEGRGIGLGNKIQAYALQEQGCDTYQANEKLGFPSDARSYDIAAAMLHLLKISNVILGTHNPRKIQGLQQQGIHVHDRDEVRAPVNEHNEAYLQAKYTKAGHFS